jgi:hypothetical protein
MSAAAINQEWALGRKSQKKIWPGMSLREVRLVVKVIAVLQIEDWIIWHKSWKNWKELSDVVEELGLDELKSNPNAVKVSIDNVE